MTHDDREIVGAIRSALADRLGSERFHLWFGQTVKFRYDRQTLFVVAPQQFVLERIQTRFRADLQGACREAAGREFSLSFCVESLPKVSQSAECKTAPRGDDATLDAAKGREVSPDFQAVEAVADTAQPQPSSDLPLVQPATRRHCASLESFAVGNGNRIAHTATTMLLDGSSQVSPLLFHGPAGCGKTHLLEGIYAHARRQRRWKRVVYLTAEQFTTYFVEALRGTGLPSFRRKYRHVDLLLLDDVHFLMGKRATLVELQHTIDAAVREGRHVVLTADRAPAALDGLGDGLAARLSGGLTCGIEPPDFETRRRIADAFARARGLELPADVLAFLASEIAPDGRQLSGAVNRLYAIGIAQQQPITRQLACEALEDLVRASQFVVRLGDIEDAVCEVFGLEPRTLQSSRKTRTISHPRMLAMWLARKYTRAAFSEIGQYFGRRSHSTVISAQKKVARWLDEDMPIEGSRGQWRIEQAIRAVETKLRTG